MDGLHAHCCVGGRACRRDMASGGWFHLSLTPREKRAQRPLCPSSDLRRPSPPGGAPVCTPPWGAPPRRKGCGCLMPPASLHLTAASLRSHRPQSGQKGLTPQFSFSRTPLPHSSAWGADGAPLQLFSSHCSWVATHSTPGQNPSGTWSLLPAASLLLSWALA